MGIIANESRTFPGARSVAVPPLSSSDCVSYPSLDALVEAESQAGHGAIIKAGRGWFESSVSELQDRCDVLPPTVSSVNPQPIVDSALETVVGDLFGPSTGKVYLGNASTWAACTLTTEQTGQSWDVDEITFTATGTVGFEDHAWLYVERSTGKRMEDGFYVTILPV